MRGRHFAWILAIPIAAGTICLPAASQGLLAVPDLGVPTGAVRAARSAYTGEGAAGSSTWLKTTRPLGEVMDHYRSQLNALGWRTAAELEARDLLVTRFALDGESSASEAAVLGAIPLDAGQMVVWIWRVRRVVAAAATGRAGGGGAGFDAGRTEALPLERMLDHLMAAAPQPPSGETMTAAPDLPSSFPEELLATGFEVMRIRSSPGRTTVVGTIDDTGNAETARFFSALTAGGWVRVGKTGGFYAGRLAASVCRSETTAAIGFDERPSHKLVGMVSVGSAPPETCAMSRRMAQAFPVPWVSVPLEWPQIGGIGGGSNSQHLRSSVRLSLVTLDAAVARIEPQIVAAGFRSERRVSGAVERIVRFRTNPGLPPAVLQFIVMLVPGSRDVDAMIDVYEAAGRIP